MKLRRKIVTTTRRLLSFVFIIGTSVAVIGGSIWATQQDFGVDQQVIEAVAFGIVAVYLILLIIIADRRTDPRI